MYAPALVESALPKTCTLERRLPDPYPEVIAVEPPAVCIWEDP